MYRTKLQTDDEISAWIYERNLYTGIAIGIKEEELKVPIIACVESVKEADGFKNRILIDKNLAEKHRFEVVISERSLDDD